MTARPDPGQRRNVVRRMAAAELDATARVLAEAFHEEPVMAWVIPDETSRLDRLTRIFSLYVHRFWWRQGEGYVAAPLVGAAMWLPPGAWKPGFLTQISMLPGSVRSLRQDFLRMGRIDSFIEKKHPEEPHWYLNAMGVVATHQGQGHGTALMRPILERCDREQTPAYLETATAGGVRLYQRNGFEVVEETRATNDGPLIFRMWREPATRAKSSTPTQRG